MGVLSNYRSRPWIKACFMYLAWLQYRPGWGAGLMYAQEGLCSVGSALRGWYEHFKRRDFQLQPTFQITVWKAIRDNNSLRKKSLNPLKGTFVYTQVWQCVHKRWLIKNICISNYLLGPSCRTNSACFCQRPWINESCKSLSWKCFCAEQKPPDWIPEVLRSSSILGVRGSLTQAFIRIYMNSSTKVTAEINKCDLWTLWRRMSSTMSSNHLPPSLLILNLC